MKKEKMRLSEVLELLKDMKGARNIVLLFRDGSSIDFHWDSLEEFNDPYEGYNGDYDTNKVMCFSVQPNSLVSINIIEDL